MGDSRMAFRAGPRRCDLQGDGPAEDVALICEQGPCGAGQAWEGPPAEGPFVQGWPCLSLPTLSLKPSSEPASLPSIAQSGFEVSGSVLCRLNQVTTAGGPWEREGHQGFGGAGLGRGLARGGRGWCRRRQEEAPSTAARPHLCGGFFSAGNPLLWRVSVLPAPASASGPRLHHGTAELDVRQGQTEPGTPGQTPAASSGGTAAERSGAGADGTTRLPSPRSLTSTRLQRPTRRSCRPTPAVSETRVEPATRPPRAPQSSRSKPAGRTGAGEEAGKSGPHARGPWGREAVQPPRKTVWRPLEARNAESPSDPALRCWAGSQEK